MHMLVCFRRLLAEQRASRTASDTPTESGSPRKRRPSSEPLRSSLGRKGGSSQLPLQVKLQESEGKSQHVRLLLQQPDGSWFPNPDSEQKQQPEPLHQPDQEVSNLIRHPACTYAAMLG